MRRATCPSRWWHTTAVAWRRCQAAEGASEVPASWADRGPPRVCGAGRAGEPTCHHRSGAPWVRHRPRWLPSWGLRNPNPRRPRYARGVFRHAPRLALASRLFGYSQQESGGRAARLCAQILQRPGRLSTARSLRTMDCSARLLSIARSRARATRRSVCASRLSVQRATSCGLPCAFPSPTMKQHTASEVDTQDGARGPFP